MIVGITSLVVFSYKIFHSRVYPVGIVRRVPAAQEYVEEATTRLSDFRTVFEPDDFNRFIAEDYSHREVARELHLSERDVKDYLRVKWNLHTKQRLRSQS